MNTRTSLALALAGILLTPAVSAQTCNAKVRRSAPDTRYVVNAVKGIVLDKQTGLTWKRCVEGQSGADCGAGSQTGLNWSGALSLAAASTFAGYRDWRLPNRKELESLVEVACQDPALNATVFPNDESSWVWASSPSYAYKITSTYIWAVDLGEGDSEYIYNNRDYLRVRLVRGGQ